MAAVDERDKILKKYMNEWDELNLDLIITPASLMPAPLKVPGYPTVSLHPIRRSAGSGSSYSSSHWEHPNHMRTLL